MRYASGDLICVGDLVMVDGGRGRVVASMDTSEYAPGAESWSYLLNGVIVDTDFGGLVHYTSADSLAFLSRSK